MLMEDIGLFRQGWTWVLSRKYLFFPTRAAIRRSRDRIALFSHRHWPLFSQCCLRSGNFLLALLSQWKASLVNGSASLLRLGPAALFVTLWSSFLASASLSSLVCLLLILAGAGSSVYYLGCNPGLFVVGLFGILVVWLYGNLWITGVIIMVGGYLFTPNNARILIFMTTLYALYFVKVRLGWHGVFLSLNLAFLSNDFLSYLFQVCESAEASPHFEEEEKGSEPNFEDYSGHAEAFSHPREPEKVSSNKSSGRNSSSSNVDVKPATSASSNVKAGSYPLDEMTRILNSSDHYDALGFPRHKHIDVGVLKKEYRKKAVLVHPDKNMGSPLASESFKKLQCAYEVLSDLEKKKNYDDQLRREELMSVSQKPCEAYQNDGMDYHSEESRRIECTKCSNAHIWVCTNRSKSNARWCQDCCQYHPAKDGDGWVEYGCSPSFSSPLRVEIPRAFVCAESKIFDVSEWAICQGMSCRPNTHRPSFHVNMVGLDSSAQKFNGSKFPWDLDAVMAEDDEEFDLWLRQAWASGVFSDTMSKRRKTWSPFKLHFHHKVGKKQRQRIP